MSGGGRAVPQWRGGAGGRDALFGVGVLLRDLQRVPVRSAGGSALSAVAQEDHAAAV